MDNTNFFVAIVLSVGILMGFHYFYEAPRQAAVQQQVLEQKLSKEAVTDKSALTVPQRERKDIIAESKRVQISTPELQGSINLKGARLDDLSLVNYRTDEDPQAPKIILFSPAGSAAPNQPYYAEFGWLGDNVAVPGANTEWQADAQLLTPSKPLRLTWNNGQGLTFERTIAIDDAFMFTITDRVKNNGAAAVTLYPFGLIARHGKPETRDLSILHEGPIGVLGGTVTEVKYKQMTTEPKKNLASDGGWIGITDKYWLTALIPAQDEKISATFSYDHGTDPDLTKGLFQTDFRGTPVSLSAGADTERSLHFFAGAKRVRLLDHYATKYQIPHFDRAIDFGWFYFLTKPFLYLLEILGSFFGNIGLAILAITVGLKAATTPLSVKSYRSMAKLKIIQPQMKALQEKYKDDQMRQSAELMDLYKREKVNPMSGCVPQLIQIPIFFALYKVLYVGIELRHAPFYGWIHDLSAADPTSVLTLFGLIPASLHLGLPIFDTLTIPHLGIWPLMMGLSMFMQQKMSPQAPDKSQARMFMFMPVLFTFMLANMAAGLVIYWTWSNILGIGQQWFVMKHAGAKK